MKRHIFLALFMLAAASSVWAQKPIKNTDIRQTPRTTAEPSPVNIPETGVPVATQPLSGYFEPKPIRFVPKGKKALPEGLKIRTSAMGLPTMVAGELPLAMQAAKTVEDKAFEYLKAISQAMHIQEPAAEFVIDHIETDELGQTHIRMNQVYKNLSVWGGAIIVHEQDGKIALMNGVYFPTPSVKSTLPLITNTAAEASVQTDLTQKGEFKKLEATEYIGGEQLRSQLIIYHPNDVPTAERLVWHVIAYPNLVHRYEYFVDAQTGAILKSLHTSCSIMGHIHEAEEGHQPDEPTSIRPESMAKTADHTESPFMPKMMLLDGPFTAQAIDLLNVTRTINTYQVGTAYYMLDASRSMFNLTASQMPSKPIGAIQTLDNNNSDAGPFRSITSANNAWNNPTAVSAHYNAGQAYLYFLNTFARSSINGSGGNITSFINVTESRASMENAYWNGVAMFYGNGGQVFLPLARGLDVAGHEMSHGVIQNTAKLRYEDEPGALNESFADIFGAMIDRNDWQIGEDVVRGRTVFPTGFLRDMANPNNGGTNLNDNGWQPKNTSEQYRGSDDNGGVHINSGITNRAYYLFANDAAVGKANAEKVFYRALTRYLVASSKFIDCRAAVEQSVRDLFTGSTATTILTVAQNAFTTVGIGSGGTTTGSQYQNDVPVNPGSEYVVFVSSDDTKLQLTNGTGTTLTTLSNRGVWSRPSVSDDGRYIVYVGADKKLYIVTFNWQANPPTFNETVLQSDPIWNNVAIAKDGTKFAANDNTDTVWVYSFNLRAWGAFKLYNPTFTQNVAVGAVQKSDALEWDHFGEKVMYDAYNILQGQNSTTIDWWDVGFVTVWNRATNSFAPRTPRPKVEKLFSDLPEDISIGDATFSKNSPHIIAFDFIDFTDPDDPGYYVVGANIQTGDISAANTGMYANNTLGYPSFSRTDNRVLFTNRVAQNNYRLLTVNLKATKIDTFGNVSTFRSDAQLGNWFANGIRVLTNVKDGWDISKILLSPNPFNDNLSVTIQAEQAAEGRIELFDMLGKNLLNTPLSITAGQNQKSLETQRLQAGTYLVKITIAGQSQISKIVKL